MLIAKRKTGFTVPQLLIAISILIIFAVLLVPNFLGRVRQAQTVRLFHDAALVEDAAEQYHLANQNESWPITGEPLAQLDIEGDIIPRPGKPPLPPDFWERVNLATFNPEHPDAIPLFALSPEAIAEHARLRHDTNKFVFRPDIGAVYVVGGITRPVVPPPPPATGRPPIAIIGGNFRIGDTTFSAHNPPQFNVTPQPGIRNVQWHNNQASFPPGEHTVSVRVQYDDGTWSDWTDYSFTVIASPPPPAPPQTAMPAPTTRSIITTSTPMNWTYDQSYDLDGHAIIAAQWENRRIYYPVGEQVVRLRVQNSLRLWSDWTVVSFNVVPTILPTAVITMSPTTNINSLTNLSFNANASIEPNGDTIVAREWQLNNGAITANPPGGQFPAGTHTVRLRVRNNAGYWSGWTQQQVVVAEALLPTAHIWRSHSHPYTENFISFGINSFVDPHGGTHAGTEWQLNNGTITTTPPNGFFPAGNHTVRARVRNGTGVWSNWIINSFTVSQWTFNLAVASPSSGATITGHPISLRINNAAHIVRVDYLINGAVVRTSTTHPFEAWWNEGNGNYTIQARAITSSGLIIHSPITSFTVSLASFTVVEDAVIQNMHPFRMYDSCTGEFIGWTDPPPRLQGGNWGELRLHEGGAGFSGSSSPVLRFNLGLIPQNAQIISARLVTSNTAINNAPASSVAVHRIIWDWSESSVLGWSTAPAPSTTLLPGVSTSNLTSLVQGWVNGTIPNLGIALTANSNFGHFLSREVTGTHTQLIIDYRLP